MTAVGPLALYLHIYLIQTDFMDFINFIKFVNFVLFIDIKINEINDNI